MTQPRPADAPFRVEVLYFDGCPNHVGLADHLRGLFARHAIAAEVAQQRIDTHQQAVALRFLSYPGALRPLPPQPGHCSTVRPLRRIIRSARDGPHTPES